MVDQKTTEWIISDVATEAIRHISVETEKSESDMLEFSVRLLQHVMTWRQNSPSSDDLDLKSIENDLVGALRLALTIEKVGGAERIILEGPFGYRVAITPESDALRSGGKLKYRRAY